MSQLALKYDGGSTVADLWSHVRGICREYVEQLGRKQVAYDLDVAGSQLSHALSETSRNYVRAEWLVYLLVNAPDTRLLQALADLQGYDLAERKPPDPAEELAALKAALEESLGPEIRRGIYARARRSR